MEKKLRRLSNCLSQVSEVVQELVLNGRHNVAGAINIDEATASTNTGMTRLDKL